MSTHFDLTPLNEYKSNKSKNDLRLGDKVSSFEASQHILLGYPDDQGIKLNGGRVGASLGPDCARKYLYKMTQNPFNTHEIKLHDQGNLKISSDLAKNHETAKENVLNLLGQNKKVISVGGGHDYAYPDGAGFLQYCKKNNLKRPLIINIDAHLDVRPTSNGLTSGTPFFRLTEEFNDFDLYEIGIQSQCNSLEHVQWCKSKGIQILNYDEIISSGLSFAQIATRFLGNALLKPRPCFLSIDIDAFSSSFAMGCSQSWPTGLSPEPFFQWLDIIKSRTQIYNLGIYELSPPLDLDDRTSKLVAQIIYRYLQ